LLLQSNKFSPEVVWSHNIQEIMQPETEYGSNSITATELHAEDKYHI
jgi:hypothetical protein